MGGREVRQGSLAATVATHAALAALAALATLATAVATHAALAATFAAHAVAYESSPRGVFCNRIVCFHRNAEAAFAEGSMEGRAAGCWRSRAAAGNQSDHRHGRTVHVYCLRILCAACARCTACARLY